MNDTITDMQKVTQMLDAGWAVQIEKNEMGSYTAGARHPHKFVVDRAKKKIVENTPPETRAWAEEDLSIDPPHVMLSDGFTPEQALTRLAYKVHGEVI